MAAWVVAGDSAAEAVDFEEAEVLLAALVVVHRVVQCSDMDRSRHLLRPRCVDPYEVEEVPMELVAQLVAHL